MNTSRLLLVAVVVVGAGLLLLLGGFFEGADRAADEAGDTTVDTRIPAVGQSEWRTYDDPAFSFTFEHPEGATVVIEAERAKVQLLGPGNPPNSEVTNGFTLYIDSEATTAGAEAHAEGLLAEQPDYAEVLEPLQSVSVGGQEAYAFTVRSALGTPVTHLVFAANGSAVYVISYLISSPSAADEESYRDIIEDIAGTLRSR